MKIVTTHTVAQETEIELPLFFLSENEGMAFFEKHQMYFFDCGKHLNLSIRPLDEKDLTKKLYSGHDATETDFMERWEKLVKQLSLTPKLNESCGQ